MTLRNFKGNDVVSKQTKSEEIEEIRALRKVLGEPEQIGVCVTDLASATQLLSQVIGIESWEFSHWPPAGRDDLRAFHRDVPADDWTARMASAQFGNIELEIVQHEGGQSTYGEFAGQVGSGVHHLMFVVDDLPSVVEGFHEKGIVTSTSVRIGDDDIRWAVLDTYALLGFNIELKARRGFG